MEEHVHSLEQRLEELRVAAIEEHNHGMADPKCPTCIEVVRQSLENARAEVATYYENIPGVTNLREYYLKTLAHEQDPNEWTPRVIAAIARGEPLIRIIA